MTDPNRPQLIDPTLAPILTELRILIDDPLTMHTQLDVPVSACIVQIVTTIRQQLRENTP